MDQRQYHVENAVERFHWWYKNRRILLADTLVRMGVKKDAALLDAGCGTGPNLPVYKGEGYANVQALDFSQAAVQYCHDKGFAYVQQGDIHHMPFGDASFDAVLSTDTLAYLDDRQALAEMARVLRPGGQVLLTAPALMSLWGQNDRDIGHKRRYAKEDLRILMEEAGFEVGELYYFNYRLVAPIWLVRKIHNLLGPGKGTESEMTSPLVNAILSKIFYWDIKSARAVNFPAGVSLMATGRKK